MWMILSVLPNLMSLNSFLAQRTRASKSGTRIFKAAATLMRRKNQSVTWGLLETNSTSSSPPLERVISLFWEQKIGTRTISSMKLTMAKSFKLFRSLDKNLRISTLPRNVSSEILVSGQRLHIRTRFSRLSILTKMRVISNKTPIGSPKRRSQFHHQRSQSLSLRKSHQLRGKRSKKMKMATPSKRRSQL